MSDSDKPTAGASSQGRETYGDICHHIETAPRTWHGGLLACAVRACVRGQFFRSRDALLRYVAATMDLCESPNAAVSDGGTPFAPRPGSDKTVDNT